mmetsp:Transcript_48883/g.104352  ORF Transcript_48883/g.104352 Transcript_48883/m.104352 type:complete len:131 (-) Transcript_48883:401-793(-)
MQRSLCLVFALLGACAAFAPVAQPAALRRGAFAARSRAVVAELETQDMWWGDKDYPPSAVLGIGKEVPSVVLGLASGLSLAIGCYCVAQSNLLNILSGSTVNGFYVFGALLVPYSWGLHVASWIQKQNGK